MKKLLGLSLSVVLALPVVALAQSGSQSGSTGSSQSSGSAGTYGSQSGQSGDMGQSGSMGQSSATSNSVKGTVSQDGKTLVADDGKSWTIANPDAVKGHEGKRVELKGSADASTNQIQVTSVKAAKGDKGAKSNSGGAMSQPQ